MVRSIPLTTGGYAWVDPYDFDALMWFAWQRDDLGYVMRWRSVAGLLRPIYMHRQIIGAWSGERVSHYDSNPLNNVFANLHLQKHS